MERKCVNFTVPVKEVQGLYSIRSCRIFRREFWHRLLGNFLDEFLWKHLQASSKPPRKGEGRANSSFAVLKLATKFKCK